MITAMETITKRIKRTRMTPVEVNPPPVTQLIVFTSLQLELDELLNEREVITPSIQLLHCMKVG